tara:strand:+ start:1104 stop:1340 length:237 start_codon:yes stop_codon:yes gene_type:complete
MKLNDEVSSIAFRLYPTALALMYPPDTRPCVEQLPVFRKRATINHAHCRHGFVAKIVLPSEVSAPVCGQAQAIATARR